MVSSNLSIFQRNHLSLNSVNSGVSGAAAVATQVKAAPSKFMLSGPPVDAENA